MSKHKANELVKKGPAKKAKPDRRALLAELESIRASLIEDTETLHTFAPHFTADNTRNTNKVDASNGEATISKPVMPIKNSSTHNNSTNEIPMPVKPTDDTSASTRKSIVAGQQALLFEQDHQSKNQQDEIEIENPFLPDHVKQRLAREKQHYQRDLETIAKMSLGLKNEEKVRQWEALVNELVNRYLPKIEAELRAELHRLIESEHEHS